MKYVVLAEATPHGLAEFAGRDAIALQPLGKPLIVSSKEVKEPVSVRYAYTQRPLGCYLYNKDGLPASPFSTNGY